MRKPRAFLLAWLVVLISGLGGVRGEEPAVLTRIAEIRALGREQAGQALPVRVRGVITLQSPGGFFLDDGEWGSWVDIPIAQSRGILQPGSLPQAQCMRGAVIEVEGVTDIGYSPQILPRRVHRAGTGELPEPRRLPMERLLTGSEDCRWVEMEGVIQEAGKSEYSNHAILIMAVDGHFCRVSVVHGENLDAGRWVDARVRIRGVFGPQVNLRSEVAGLQMYLSGLDDMRVVTPPPADPFASPRVALNRLLPFAPDEAPGHRKVTRGVVTFVDPGKFFFLQDGLTGVRVESVGRQVKLGEMVEVAGFVTTEHTLAALRGAVVRHVSQELMPPAVPVTPAQLMHPRLRSKWTGEAIEDASGRRVRLQGRLLRSEKAGSDGGLELMIEADGVVFSALLPAVASSSVPPAWVDGSMLELKGTCELDFKTQPVTRSTVAATIDGFRLWLPSPQEVRVLQSPPWWTPMRLGLALWGTAAVLLLALAWVSLLRREVGRRGVRLAQEIAARRDTRLEFDTTLRERTRLANDLHDTLEQALTGLSLQLQAADLFQGTDPDRSARHLRLAQQFLDRSREDVHRTVWDLRAHGLAGRSLVEALRERVHAMVAGSSIQIEVASEGEVLPMPDVIAGNLLLLAQEAVTNALKHAHPQQVAAHVVFGANGVSLRITDDGAGFDPATAPDHRHGHFGLQGMRERVKRLGGTLEIDSAPGRGTRIEVCLTAAAFGVAPAAEEAL